MNDLKKDGLFEELTKEYSEVFISMLNLFLDTLYDENENNPSAPLYEELRRRIIDKKPLTVAQKSLLLILTSYNATRIENIIKQYTVALEGFVELREKLTNLIT